MFSKNVFFVSLFVSSLVSLSENKEFCQSFKDIGFKVDYAFQNTEYIKEVPESIWSLFVGHDYWLIEGNTDKVDVDLGISEESHTSQHFGSQYHLAFSTKLWNDDSKITYKNTIGLLRKEEYRIDWGIRSTDKIQDFTNISSIDTQEYRKYLQDFDPSYSITILDNWHCFGEQILDSSEFSQEYRCLEFSDGTKFEAKNIDQDVEKYIRNRTLDPNANVLRNIRSKHQIIGIFGPNRLTSKYTIFYLTDKSISYCTTRSDSFHLECATNLKLLIDCSPASSSWSIYIFIGLSVVLVLIVMALVSCFIIKKWKAPRTQDLSTLSKDLS